MTALYPWRGHVYRAARLLSQAPEAGLDAIWLYVTKRPLGAGFVGRRVRQAVMVAMSHVSTSEAII